MVKKFISGLLKKKDKNEAGAKTAEEVPEELPPLAEDVAAKADVKAEDAKLGPESAESSKAQEQAQEPPGELPSLDLNFEDSSEQAEEKDTVKEKAKEDLPEEIKKAKAAKAKEESGAESGEKEAEEATTKPAGSAISGDKIRSTAEIGFFSSILDHIRKQEGSKDKLLAGDLFSRMANYWELKKDEIKTGAIKSREEKLEEELKLQLEKLRILEHKWQVQKLALDEDLKFLHEREIEIQTKVEELKRISNELGLFKSVKPEEYFYMYNGVVLKCLHDLIDALEIIDDDTFFHHVNSGRNDFSDWMSNILKDRNLAEKIRNARTKEEMIEILETVPVVVEVMSEEQKRHLPPKKYFWLANGVVIKSLYQLSDALKAMDDELFDKHVSDERNDFCIWVKDIFKNEDLAERLDKAKTRSGMIEVLDIFLN